MVSLINDLVTPVLVTKTKTKVGDNFIIPLTHPFALIYRVERSLDDTEYYMKSWVGLFKGVSRTKRDFYRLEEMIIYNANFRANKVEVAQHGVAGWVSLNLNYLIKRYNENIKKAHE